MPQICAISVEGVLALDTDLKSAQPTRWARQLYDGLHSQYRMIALTENQPEVADYWLRREMLRDWAGVLIKPDAYNSFRAWKIKQVEEFLAEGWEVGMVIDIDQVVLEQVNSLGVATMLVSYPAKRVGWREATPEVRAWTEIVADLE